jgi:acetoacetate decarboxylase
VPVLERPNYLLKIIRHVDGTPRILELIDYRLEDIVIKGAWSGPAMLEIEPHALAPIAELPAHEIISATHIIADLTLGLGKVVYDYLKP